MTNALAQNVNIEQNSTIDILAQALNVTSSKNEDSAKFSNIVNDLNARFNKAQSEFEKKANVTNTSSVNKEALVKKEIKKETKDTSINETSTSVNTKEIKTTEKKEIKQTQNVSEDKEVSENKVLDKSEDTNTDIKEISQTKENLSDINNSSPVESSPVFSSDKIEINEETKENIESALKEVQNVIDDFKYISSTKEGT